MPIFIGSGPVQKSNEQSKGASRNISYLITMVNTCWTLISLPRIRCPSPLTLDHISIKCFILKYPPPLFWKSEHFWHVLFGLNFALRYYSYEHTRSEYSMMSVTKELTSQVLFLRFGCTQTWGGSRKCPSFSPLRQQFCRTFRTFPVTRGLFSILLKI